MSEKHINTKHLFTGGLNLDDDPQAIPPGDYTNAEGVQIMTEGSASAVINDYGWTLLDGVTYPSGTNTCIGATADENSNTVIFFVYHSTAANHSIYEYNIDTDTFITLYRSAVLNFDPDYRITAKVIGNYLIWISGNNEQRRLDLSIARTQEGERQFRLYFGKWEYLNFTSNAYVRSAFANGTQYVPNGMSFIFTVSTNYSSLGQALNAFSTALNANEAGNPGGARYSSVVKDGYVLVSEIGAQTPVTNVAITISPGVEQFAWVVPHNYISDYDDVRNIEYARRAPVTNPFWSLERLALDSEPIGVTASRSLNKRAVEFAYSFEFFDKTESVLSEFSPIKGYEYIDDGKINSFTHLVVNIIESLIDPTVSKDFLRDVIGINVYYREGNSGTLKFWKIFKQNTFYPNSDDNSDIGFYFTQDSIGTVASTDKSVKYFESVPLIARSMESVYTDNGTVLSFGDLTENYDYQDVDMVIEVKFGNYIASTVNGNYYQPIKYLKRGSRYKAGVIFRDKFGRTLGVATNSVNDIYVPRKTEEVNAFSRPSTPSSGYQREGAYIDWDLNPAVSNIPLFAHSYQLALTANLTYGWFRSFQVEKVKLYDSTGAGADITVRPGTPFLQTYKSSYEFWIGIESLENEYGDAYSYVEGDRLRVLKTVIGDPSLGGFVWADAGITGVDGTNDIGDADFEILGVDGTAIRISAIDNHAYNVFEDAVFEIRAGLYSRLVVEIWRPSQASEDIFYPIGECLPIDDPETGSRAFSETSNTTLNKYGDSYVRYHDSTIKSPDGSQSASIEQLIAASFTGVFREPVEVPNRNYKQYPLDWSYDKGRPYVYLPNNAETVYPGKIRITNQLTSTSEVNQLFTIDSSSQVQIPEQFGAIRVIGRVGDVLLVLTNTSYALSFYLQKVTSVDAAGSVLAAFSDALIGGKNVLAARYGTQHPESFVVQDGHAFWVDAAKRAVLKYSTNGIDKISKIKMEKRFTDRLSQVDETQNIIGTFDYDRSNYLVYGIDDFGTYGLDAKTYAFNNDRGRWTGFFPYQPEVFVQVRALNFAFNTSVLFLMNDIAQDRNTYPRTGLTPAYNYGYKVEFVINNDPETVKLWLSIEQNSTSLWVSELITNEKGQETEIPEGVWEEAEGTYNAEILMDKNSIGPDSESIKLIDGDPMRSRSIRIELSGDDVTETKLRSLIVRSIVSMRTTV